MVYAAAVFLLGLVATPAAIGVMRRLHVVDLPNPRSSHSCPTIRGAGVGVALVATSALAVAAMQMDSAVLGVIVAGAAACAAVGLIDDLRDLSVRYRLALQVTITIGAVIGAETFDQGLLLLAAIVAVVGYLNAFNFMDGINGISGFHAAGVGLTWAVAGFASGVDAGVLLGAMLTAAAVAFLPYNFPRARAFLGDVGSYFFGGWIAFSALVLYGQLPGLVIVLPLLPYVADTGWTLLRRVRRGETWHEAHREHVYQRLTVVGWSHARSAGLVGGLTLLSGAGALVGSYGPGSAVVTGAIVAFVLLLHVGYLVLPAWATGSEKEGVPG